MPVKLLLADKSITIQKVVEMLFSGRDYEVVCVSDGETALSDAARVIPDVILADVDLPRLDGYAFAGRLKMTPQLAPIPVILMMSRDDVYDSVKGKQAGILDYIAKPFESQELIGKVKKALTAAPPRRLAEPASQPVVAAPEPMPAPAAPKFKAAVAADRSVEKAPTDILDIISEAPSRAQIPTAALPTEEAVYEVEPVMEEMAEQITSEIAQALPVGEKAVEEMRAGLGLAERSDEPQPEIVTFESLGMALEAGETAQFMPAQILEEAVEYIPPAPTAMPQAGHPPASEELLHPAAPETGRTRAQQVPAGTSSSQPPVIFAQELRTMAAETGAKKTEEVFAQTPPPALSPSDMWSIAEETVAKMAKDVFAKMPPPQPPAGNLREMVAQIVQETVGKTTQPALPADELRVMAEETISRIALDAVRDMTPPIPKISDETIRRGIEEAVGGIVREIAKEVIERVAWEVIPHLAEVLIKEEIERLKAGS